MNKLRIAILFGGRSTEHEISLLSAKNVIEALDREKYEAVLIGIDKNGRWLLNENSLELFTGDGPKNIGIKPGGTPIILSQNAGESVILDRSDSSSLGRIDVIFPVLHGTFGEDGSVQGFARLANIPCVGCGIAGSAIGMDKDVTKRLLRDAGLGIADFVTLRRGEETSISYEKISAQLGSEIFVKPANLGSSVGISFVANKDEYEQALKEAFLYDTKLIIEEKVMGRELECAVLGNDEPRASVIGEVLPKSSWYSFDNKYVDDDGAALQIPAMLDDDKSDEIRAVACIAYKILECMGMTRVDFFMKHDGSLIINEVNTIPGFTKISMYPKLWEATGLKYTKLISTLIELAREAHKTDNQLKHAV